MENIHYNNYEDSYDETSDVVNPEIPTTPQEKFELMELCVNALQNGKEVEGVTANHITPDGMRMLKNATTTINPPQY